MSFFALASPHSPRLFDRASALLLLSLLAFGCGSSTEQSEPRSEVVIGSRGTLDVVNEYISQGTAFSSMVRARMFLRLADEEPDYAAGPPTFSPRLARSWELSEDREELTFHLRDDVVWSDGVPVTAADVRYTWEAQISPDVGWTYAFVKEAIRDVEVLDDHTVRFHFDQVTATQMMDALEGHILPRHVYSQLPFDQWRGNPGWFEKNLVVNGPFLLAGWSRGQQIDLVRNPLYYEPGMPRLERVVFRHFPSSATAVQAFLAGEVDVTYGFRASDAVRIEQDSDRRLLAHEGRQFTLISWNTLRPWFADPLVRRALAHAVDRQSLVDTLWHGYANVGSSPVVSWVWAHNRELEPLDYDPDQARKLLGQAGWVDRDGDGIRERDGLAFRFELTANSGNETRWDALQMMRSQLADVGIDADLRQVESETLFALNLAHDYDATITAIVMDTSLDLSYGYHTDAIEGAYNFGSYSNPEADELMDRMRALNSLEDALPSSQQLQAILHRDQPVLILWEPFDFLAHHRDLDNVEVNAIDGLTSIARWSWAR